MTNYKLWFLSILLIIGSSTHTQAQCLTEDEVPPKTNPNLVQSIADARYHFAVDALKEIADIQTQDNIFFSPHSLYQALSLVYFGAKNHTEVSMKKALRLADEVPKTDIQRYYSFERSAEQERKINDSVNYDFVVANRLWFSSLKKIRQCIKDLFGDELEQVDFRTNPDDTRKQINNWVSNTTRGNIKDLLPPNSIDESTDSVLANAVYFKGLWQSKFLPENTAKDNFYFTQNNSTLTTYMKQKGSFNYAVSEVLGAHVLQLPYKGEDVSMYILLPPNVSTLEEKDNLRQILNRLTKTSEGARELHDILEYGMPPRDVEVMIPKFKWEKQLEVKPLLSALGASPAIEPDTTNLSGFVEDGEQSPYLGDAIHRARIDVDEEGTTAAAATAIFSFRSSRPTEPAYFKADHPFLFFIYDQLSRNMLFAGVFRQPMPVVSNNN